MVKRNKSKMCNKIKVQNNKMCKKTVYWDLINSNVNKRDVHKAAIWVMRSFTVNNLVSVYETWFVFRSLMA